MIETLEILDDLIGRILSHFSIFSDDEKVVSTAADRIGQNLIKMTRNVRDFVSKVDEWFTDERIQRIAEYFTTAKGVISTVSAAISETVSFALKMLVTLWPVFDAVLDNISTIIKRVTSIFNQDDVKANDGLKQLKNGFSNILTAVKPLVTPLTNFVNILGEIGGFIAEIFAGTAVSNIQFFADTIGFALEVLGFKSAQAKEGVSVLDSIKNSIIDLGNACKDTFNFVFDFFRSLYDDLRLVLGMREAEEGEEGGFFSNLLKFFETSEFIKNVKAKFTEVWQTIDTFFFGEEVEVTGKRTTWTQRTQSEFSKMVESAITAINTFVTKTVPKYAKQIWDSVMDFLFGKKIVTVKYNNGQLVTTYTRFKSGFSAFLDKIFTAIKTFITKDLPKAVSDVWNKVVEALFGKKEVEAAVNSNTSGKNDAADKVKGGFSKWLTQAIESVKSWIVSIPGTIKSLWNTIIDVIFYRDAKPDEVNPDTGTAYAPNTRVLNAFAEWVKNIPNNILDWLKNDLPEKAAEIWDKVIDFIFGKQVEPGTVDLKTGKDYPPNTRIKEGFSAWLATAVQTVKDWVKTAKETIAGLWDIVLDSIFGYNDASDVNRYTTKKNGSAEKLSANAAEGIVQTVGSSISEEFESDNTTRKGILETARTFIENLGIDIGKLLAALPTYIVEGWNFSLNIFKDLAERITGWLKTINLSSATEEEVVNSFDNPDEGSLVSAIVKFGQNIVEVVTTVLPPLFKEGWAALTGHADDLWNAVKSIFGIDNTVFNFEDLGKQAEAFGTKVADTIRSIPGYIRTAIEAVKKEFTIEEFDHQLYDQLLIVNPAAAEQYRHEYAGKQRNGLWEAIKSIFGSFGDLVKDLGPDILEGINSLFSWIGEQFTKATDFMAEAHGNNQTVTKALEEKLEDENDEDHPLWEAMKKIGETIKNLIVNVIPNFISEGIEELKMRIPDMFSSLFGEDTVDGITRSITGSSQNFFDQVTEKIAGGKEAVNAFLTNLTQNTVKPEDVLSDSTTVNIDEKIKELSDEIWDAQFHHTKNDYEIVQMQLELQKYQQLKSAGAKEVDVDNSDNIVKSLESTKSIIDRLLEFGTSKTTAAIGIIAALAWLFTEIKDLVSVTDEVESVGYTFKWIGISILMTGITGILGYMTYLASLKDQTKFTQVSGLFDKIGAFIEKLGWIFGIISALKLGTSIFDWLGEKAGAANGDAGGTLVNATTIATSFAVFSGLFSEGLENIFDGLLETVQSIGVAIESIMVYLEPGIKRMAALNDDLEEALLAFSKFTELIAKFKELLVGKGFFGIEGGGEQNAAYMQDVYEFLKDVDFEEEQIDEIKGSGTLLEKTPDDQILSSIETRIEWMYMLANFVTELGNALQAIEVVKNPAESISKITEMIQTDEFNKLFKTLFDVIFPFEKYYETNPVDTEFVENTAANIRLLSNALSLFTESIAEIPTDQIGTLNLSLEIIKQLATLVQEGGVDNGMLEELVSGDNTIGRFGRVLIAFGGNLEAFFEHIKKISADEKDFADLTAKTDLVLKAARSISLTSKNLQSIVGLAALDNFLTDGSYGSMASGILTFIDTISKYEFENGLNVERVNAVISIIDSIGQIDTSKLYSNNQGIALIYEALIGGDAGDGFLNLLVDVNDGINKAIESMNDNGPNYKMDRLTNVINTVKDVMDILNNFNIDEHMSSNLGSNLVIYHLSSDIDRIELIRAALLGEEGYGGFFSLLVELNDAINEIRGKMKTSSDFDTLMSVFENLVNLVSAIDNIMQTFESTENSTDVISSIMDSLILNVDKIKNFTESIGAINQADIDKAVSLFTSLNDFAEAVNVFKSIDVKSDFLNLSQIGFVVGSYFDAGLAEGIAAKESAVTAAKNLATKIGDAVKEVLKISSPSKVMEEYGMYMDEGLAQGIAKYSYDPLAEAGDMADSLVDKMQRVLANPNAPDSLKAQVQNLLDNMVDEGTYNQALEGFGAKLGEDAGQTMRAATEEELKKAAEANQSGPGFLDYVTLAWNRIWNTDSDIPGFKSRFVQNAENIINGTWDMLKDKIVEGANKVGPTFTETVMGILAEHEESSWELDESAFHLLVDNFNVLLGAALTDLKDNSTSAIKKKGIDLFGEIINAATDESQGGNLFSRIGNVLFGDIKDYINQNKYVAMARSVFSNIFNAVKDESSENSGVVATTIFDSILSSTNAVSGNSAAFDAILGALHSFWDTAQVTMEQDLSLTPQIAPQLVLTDQFMADASKISQLVGGNINPSVLSGLNLGLNGALNTTLDLANQLDMPTTFDYTAQLSDILHKISDMNSNVKAFDTALRNTRFVINGDRLTDVIGPSMDEWLGREGFYVARRNAT